MLKTLLLLSVVMTSSSLVSLSAHAEIQDQDWADLGVRPEQIESTTLMRLEQASDQATESSDQIGPIPESEDVTSDSLHLIGRGIFDPKHGEALALAFYDGQAPSSFDVEHPCARLRYVYFNVTEHTAKYIGKIYPVACAADEATAKELKTALKPAKTRYKEYRKIANKRRRFGLLGGLFSGTLSGTVITLGFIPGVTFGTGVLIFTGVAVSGFSLLMASEKGATLFTPSTNVSTVMMDRNGWNWSSKPKKVSPHAFALYYYAFASDSNTVYR